MAKLKQLDSTKISEEQAINVISTHFPIAVQAFIQTSSEKMFLNIWEKLREVEKSINTENPALNETNTKTIQRYNNYNENRFNNQKNQQGPNYSTAIR